MTQCVVQEYKIALIFFKDKFYFINEMTRALKNRANLINEIQGLKNSKLDLNYLRMKIFVTSTLFLTIWIEVMKIT